MNPEEYYKMCNLKGNPFRPNAKHETDPNMGIWAGYEKEKNTFFKYLNRTRADQIGNENLLLVYGDLGVGKTHACLWARYQITQFNKEEFNSVAYFVPTLKQNNKLTFAGAFKLNIVLETSLISDLLSFKHFLRRRCNDYIEINKLDHGTDEKEILKNILPSQDLINFCETLLDLGDEESIKSFLIPRTGFTDHMAMLTFTKIVNLFVFEFKISDKPERFKNAVYLFIDELDTFLDSPQSQILNTNDDLRHIYDSCPLSFCMVLTFTATAAELTSVFTEPVLSRVTKQIHLALMNQEDSINFIKSILNNHRENDTDINNGAYPFDDDALNLITSQITSVTPRKIMRNLHEILEELRLQDFDPESNIITADILQEKNILDDISDDN